MGSGPVGGLCYRSCMSGESGIHQKDSPLFHEIQYGARALVPRVVVNGRGEPEDDGRDEGGAGECK